MANYEFIVISNEFKTRNNQEVANVFLDLGFEETYVTNGDNVFVGSYSGQSIGWDCCKVLKDKNTNKLILAYDKCEWDLFDVLTEKNLTDIDLENTIEVDLINYLQDMLLDNEHFSIKEVGNEKLRYAIGHACLITKTKEVWFDLDNLIKRELNK